MEELAANCALNCNELLLTHNMSLIASANINSFKNDKFDAKEEPKLLEIEQIDLEMDQICRGCLSTYNVVDMKNTFNGGITSVMIYEKISNIKVELNDVPARMCSNCIEELAKINDFLHMLKRSYAVLSNAAREFSKLAKQKNVDIDLYNKKKKCILQKVLLEKYTLSCVQDKTFQAQSSQENDKLNEDDLLDHDADDISIHNDNELSEDETPLSERFKADPNRRKEYNKISKIKRKSLHNKKDVPKKIVSDNATPNSTKEKFEIQIERFQDICPLCSTKIRYIIKHLYTIHSLDWNDSKCLHCLYTNSDKDKLIEHCKECPGVDYKYDNSGYVETTQLKVEDPEEADVPHDCDPDFEPDELDKDSPSKLDLVELKRTQSNRKKGRHKKYSCNKCENVCFNQYQDIESHLKIVHSSESKCILCELEFTNSFSLLYHMMVKHGKVKCCRLCLVSFRNSGELNLHYKSEEHNTKCTVCGEQFRNRKALYEHRRKRHLNPQLENQKYKCPECPKEFANQNNIRRHIMVAHNDLRFLCDTCGQSYTTKRNLKLHIQKFHEGVQVENKNTKKNFFCEACGRELKIFHKYAIAMHRAKHKGHNFVCKKCYDSFPTEQDFKQHVEELRHQLYECDKCQSQFVREENFKVHLKNHDAPGWNKNMFATWGKSAKLRNEKGEFVCSYCPKVFKDKQRLDNHVRVHTNERPYKCHICNKGFKTWIHRKTHLNIHLGIKKWVCKYCSKAFTNSCTLKGHEMIHTGERPHRCPECKKGFITMSAMKKHRMVHFRTGGSSYRGKGKIDAKDDDKTDSEHEENVEFIYKYGQMFAGNDVDYESFNENPKEPPAGLVSIEKGLSC